MRNETAHPRAPVLVLGIGNVLLADDGVGPALLELLRPEVAGDPRIELVDGGTQGLMLLGILEGRRSLLLLDAVRLGAEPGRVHRIRAAECSAPPRGLGAHGSNASELLFATRLLGMMPDRVELIGVEPADLSTKVGLSAPVSRALPSAAALAREQIRELLAAPATPVVIECTS